MWEAQRTLWIRKRMRRLAETAKVGILAPTGRDAELAARELSGHGVDCTVCRSTEQLVQLLPLDLDVAIIAEEALDGPTVEAVRQRLSGQPKWSDVPLLVLVAPGEHRDPLSGDTVQRLGHVTLVQRPVSKVVLVNAVTIAVRTRARQYEMRDELAARQVVQDQLQESRMQLIRAREQLSEALLHEHDVSRTLQESLIPRVTMTAEGVTVEHVYNPAGEAALVGGDFFDVFEPSPHCLAVNIGDVAGKGVRAAIHTGMVKHTLRAYAFQHHEPSEVMTMLNATVARELSEDSFITLFYGVMDLEERELTFVSAGHEPPVWMLPDGRVTELSRPQPPLGIFPETVYDQARVEVDTGHRILLYTDGLIEARGDGSFYGPERLLEFCSAQRDATPRRFLRRLMSSVQEFTSGKPHDDIAAMLLAVE